MNFQEYVEIIEKTYEKITKNDVNRQLQPAEEWIRDNYYVICENLDKCRLSYKNLPRMINKAQINNLYRHMTEIVKKSNGVIDERRIIEYFREINKTKPLAVKEITCVEEVLRFSLISKLANVCEYIENVRSETEKAETLFGRYLNYIGSVEDKSTEAWLNAVGDITPVFAQTVLKLCASKLEDTTQMRQILTRKLAGRSTGIDEIIAIEHKNAITNGVLAGNLVNSMRALSGMDWQEIMSSISVVKQILKNDPSGIYARMTDESADEYVAVIDKYCKKTRQKPETVAQEILEKAQRASGTCTPLEKHVGYYVYKLNKNTKSGRAFYIYLYFTMFVLNLVPDILIVENVVSLWQKMADTRDVVLNCAITLASLVIVICLAIISFNIAIRIAQKRRMQSSRPNVLPALEFNGRLPENCHIMIVIPCLISSEKRALQLASELEKLYFSNHDDNICYTLLADLPESNFKDAPQDRVIHDICEKLIALLNEKYCPGQARFFYRIRERTYYENDKKWRGYERKRGALLELCRDIKNGRLPHVDFVLTIDAGTTVPGETVCKMAQIMMHPLNKPEIKLVNNVAVVVNGYGILQPAVMPLTRKSQSVFSKIMSGSRGFDIYGAKYSDFYADIFREGIYTGKGMFDPEIYLHILGDIFPDNSILSHDLLEGSFLRCAFASDIRLYDEYPPDYLSSSARLHRWTRGDWQLIPYIKRNFRSKAGRFVRNPINGTSKFKMAANLLSSLLPASVLFTVIFGLLFIPAYKYLWVTIMGVALLACYSLREVMFEFLFLPHKAVHLMDAIIRAIWRTNVSRLNMLEWVTSADGESKSRGGLFTYYSEMMANLIAAVLCFRFLGGVLSVIWILAPLVAYITSKNMQRKNKSHKITAKDRKELTGLAYKIWKYYDVYADKSNHYLPPDNVQFITEEKVARRTSPTNIGFCMLSIAISHRFDFICRDDAINRLGNMLDTIEKLPKYKGHLYNWTDTTTLSPMRPLFISTVDSGNFIACCICVRQMLLSYNCEKPSEEVRVDNIRTRLADIIFHTDFTFLYDGKKKAFSTGFIIEDNKIAPSFYDILASESRLTMYIAVALGQLPLSCYTSAARRFSHKDPDLLLSWSGTSFEYLLPELFFKTDYVSMWDSVCRAMIKAQIDYAREKNLAWGVSESGFFRQDISMNYKYKAHGVKTCALCACTEDSLVISAYSSILAIDRLPENVMRNLKKLENDGGLGEYGYYEAIDYSDDKTNVVKSFMAHHLGMELAAICNLLCDDYVRGNFMSCPSVASAEYLLAEKNNKKILVKQSGKNYEYPVPDVGNDYSYACKKPVGLYSNGEFSAIFHQNSIVKTLCAGVTITDRIYIMPQGGTNEIKSLYVYSEKVALTEQTHWGAIDIESCVSAEDNCLACKIKAKKNTVITIYADLKMATDEDYTAHPAFCDIFVVTHMEKINNTPVLFASKNDGRTQQGQMFMCAGLTGGVHPEFDTDSLSVKGRSNTPESIFQSSRPKPLEGNLGAVINPCIAFSLKMPIDEEIGFFIGAGKSIEEIRAIGRKYTDFRNINRAFELSKARGRIEIEHLNLAGQDVNSFFARLPNLISPKPAISARRKLWQFGISGDRPLICVSIMHPEKVEELKKIMRMWSFYSFRGFAVDLALVCLDEDGYIAPIRDMADTLVTRALSIGSTYHGEIYILSPENGSCPTALSENADIFYQL